MAYLSEGSKVGGKQIETVDGAQAKANQAKDSAVDTVLRWAKDLGLGTTAKAIQNWDELEQTGFYNGNNNGPLGNSIVFGIHVQHSSNYGLQVVGRHNRLFIRTRENDIWNDWRELESVDKVESKLNELKNNEVEPLKTRVSNAEKSINQLSNEVSSKVSITEFESLQIGGRNLIKDSNNFTNYTKYGGATVTFTTGVSVPEWNATDATRIQTSGGTLQTKLYKDVVTPSVAGQQYTVSVWVKNIGSYPVVVSNNLYSDIGRVNPGEQKRVIITGIGNGVTNLQIKFQTTTDGISNPLDFIVWRAKVELGNRATDWTPAPEDIFQEITSVKNSSAPISHVGSGGNAHALATPSAHGFMSSSDKAKLDGIQAGAEVNQNTFSTIKVGSTNVVADSKTDTLELVAGTNVVLTPDATNDRITIGLSSNVETVSGAQAKANAVQANLNAHIGSGGNAHALATTSAHGFMSSSDKSKLNGIQAGAEVNQNAFTHIKVGSTTVSADSKTDTLELVAGTNVVLTPDATNDKITIGLSSNVETTSGAQAKVNAHANRKDNPHGVTKAQVGLGSVENYGIATQAEAEAGTANDKYMTPLRTKQLVDKFAETPAGAQAKVDAHANRKDNPHYVTASQVGAYSIAEADAKFWSSADSGGEVIFGSNSNGQFIRFPNGVQICYSRNLEPTQTTDNDFEEREIVYWGSLYKTFPAEFVATPAIVPYSLRLVKGSWAGIRTFSRTHVEMYLMALSPGAEAHLGYIAIGRWK